MGRNGSNDVWMRWGLLVALTCSLAFLNTDSSTSAVAQETPTPPNIVFVLTDDLDYASSLKMPTISRLASDGATFENAYNSYPLCCPSRTTILTGLYAHNHGVKSNSLRWGGGFEKFESRGLGEKTVALTLQAAGYRTGFFGKYLNGYPGGVPPGWDEWVAIVEPNNQAGASYFDYSLNENGRLVSYGSEEADYQTDVLSRKVRTFIRGTSGDRPFFAFVAASAPHGPSTPAPRHDGMFAGAEAPRPPSFDEEDVSDKPPWITAQASFDPQSEAELDQRYRDRLQSMMAVDEMVGTILEELEGSGQLDNTYIFFASDNGWMQGEHRIQQKKRYPYEESARTPLFVRGPGIAAGSEIDELALNTDFADTFSDLAGTTFTGDGRSLVPLLHGKNPAWRSQILLEGFKGNENPPAYWSVRTERYKYVKYRPGYKEFYDLMTDPYELENSIDTADPTLIADLRAKLDALKDCSGRSCRAAEDAP